MRERGAQKKKTKKKQNDKPMQGKNGDRMGFAVARVPMESQWRPDLSSGALGPPLSTTHSLPSLSNLYFFPISFFIFSAVSCSWSWPTSSSRHLTANMLVFPLQFVCVAAVAVAEKGCECAGLWSLLRSPSGGSLHADCFGSVCVFLHLHYKKSLCSNQAPSGEKKT